MSAKSNPDLSRLAESISDGVKIDWQADADQVGSQTRSALYILEQIAQMHRDVEEPTPTETEDNGEMWGPLQVGSLLGEGGFGQTHLAFDPMLQREVALKRAHGGDGESSLRAWIAEARRLARVRHPNVLAIYGARIYGGQAGIWTELIDGQSLSSVIRDNGTMSAREAAAVGIDLCSALSAVHQAGLIHGDVKPGNVLRERGGRIVLLDFGSSRELGNARLEAGSPAFLAPELLRGEPATVRSDIYAMGVTLYFLAAGEYPVERTLEGLHDTNERPVPLRERRPDLPAAFVDVVNRALAESPEDRYASAAELEAALQGDRAASPRGQWRWLSIAALVLGAVVLGTWLRQPADSGATVDVDLFRQSAAGVAGAVTSGDVLALGDRLSLQVQTEDSRYAYVLNEDDHGEAFVLFPLSHLDTRNPIAPNESYELPGTANGQRLFWQVTSSGGSERFVVVLATSPLAILEDALAQWRQAGSRGAAAALPETTLRGVGGLAATPKKSASSQLDRMLEQLPEDGSVILREFLLQNP